MNKQTLYIIFIIAIFNFLLINIFRLQKEITNIRNKTNKVKGYMDSDFNKYKKITDMNDNNKTGVNQIMNDIAELVPIDFNKISESKVKFTPKYKQV
jgi:hypothetical protein